MRRPFLRSKFSYPYFRCFPDATGRWRWSLYASNGRIVADSGQGYATKWGCKRAAERLADIAAEADFDIED